jgi:hypothetical protein
MTNQERTTMKTFMSTLCVLALAIPVVAVAQKPKEPVTVSLIQHDAATDFTKFKTYSWTRGHAAIDPTVDAQIVAAIDTQLAAKGLTRAEKSDVVVCYHSVERVDVDLATFDENPAPGAARRVAQTVRVGTLVVDLKSATTNALVWRAKAEGVTSNLPAANRPAFLNGAVAKLFALYPPPKTARKK